MPVEARVEAIFFPISPDLPMPVTTTLPSQSRITSTAFSKLSSIRLINAAIASASILRTFFASFFIILLTFSHEGTKTERNARVLSQVQKAFITINTTERRNGHRNRQTSFNEAKPQTSESKTNPLNRQDAKDAKFLIFLKSGFKLSFATLAPSR